MLTDDRRAGRVSLGPDGPYMSTVSSQIALQRTAGVDRPGRRVLEVGAIWLIAGLLPLYLALEDGGYETIVRSEAGVAVWWALLVGSLSAVLPLARPARLAWGLVAALGGLAAWTLLSATWAASDERAVVEAARLATHVGVLLLALCVVRRQTVPHLIGALAAAIAVVGALALVSRLHPSWLPQPRTGEFLPSVANRLAYPLAYWNALGALLAIGVPLLLHVAASARSITARSAAAGAVPIVATAMYMTYSRGAILSVGAGLIVLVALWPARLALVAGAVNGAVGAGLLIAAINQRGAFADGLGIDLALRQGEQVEAIACIVVLGCILVQAAIGLTARHVQRPWWLAPSPRRLLTLVGIGAAAMLAVALVAGLPGAVGDAFEEFKQSDSGLTRGQENTAERLTMASGKGRYQLWEASVDAFSESPVRGIGAGGFEFYNARHGSTEGFVRNAHSLWFETLAEVGAVGLLLLAAFFAVAFAAVGAAVRRGGDGRRSGAVVGAGLAAFCLSATFEWTWQVTIIPIVVVLLLAAVVAGDDRPRFAFSIPGRVALAMTALAGVVLIALPLSSALAIRESQERAQRADLIGALSAAGTARDAQPFAASPLIQQALVLERAGSMSAAVASARRAADDEPSNWRTWLVLSRIEAQAGNAHASVTAYRRARVLNPRSPLFARD